MITLTIEGSNDAAAAPDQESADRVETSDDPEHGAPTTTFAGERVTVFGGCRRALRAFPGVYE
jgi:hypothetical protein